MRDGDVVVGCDVEAAAEAWREFDFRRAVAGGPSGRVEETLEERAAEEEFVRFEQHADGSTLVTVTVEYDEDEVDDLTVLRADIEDELARYRESIERRAA